MIVDTNTDVVKGLDGCESHSGISALNLNTMAALFLPVQTLARSF